MSADEKKKIQRVTIDRVENGFIVSTQKNVEDSATPYVCTINNLRSLVYELFTEDK